MTQSTPQAPDVRAALQELVALKDLKDRLEGPLLNARGNERQWCEVSDEYERRKPLAWAAARAALAADSGNPESSHLTERSE